VRGALGQRHHHGGLRRQQHLVERAVGVVAGVQVLHREHACQQRRDPGNARRHGAQHLRLGAHPQREQAGRDDEEGHRQQHFHAAPCRQAQLAAQDGNE
jgi:hypothetical protein